MSVEGVGDLGGSHFSDATTIGGWGCARLNYTPAFALQRRKTTENLSQGSLKVLGKNHCRIRYLFTGSLHWLADLSPPLTNEHRRRICSARMEQVPSELPN